MSTKELVSADNVLTMEFKLDSQVSTKELVAADNVLTTEFKLDS